MQQEDWPPISRPEGTQDISRGSRSAPTEGVAIEAYDPEGIEE
jgi:hypothetical protein